VAVSISRIADGCRTAACDGFDNQARFTAIDRAIGRLTLKPSEEERPMAATLKLHSEGATRAPRIEGPDEDHVARNLWLWGEAYAGIEWLALRMSPIYAGIGVPRGDGAGVVLIPGMLASNTSMIELWDW